MPFFSRKDVGVCVICGEQVKFDRGNVPKNKGIVMCNMHYNEMMSLMYPKENITDRSYKMPGMQTIGQMDGVEGSHYAEVIGNDFVVRCNVVHTNDTQTTWDYYAYTGKVDNIKRRVSNEPTGGIWEPFETTNPNYVMPGLKLTVAQLGGPGTRPAKHYKGMVTGKRRWFIHCLVFQNDGTHLSWKYDPNNGEVFDKHPRLDNLKVVKEQWKNR